MIEHDSNTNGPGARGKHLNGEAPVVGTLHCLPETSGERWAIVIERHGFENSKPPVLRLKNNSTYSIHIGGTVSIHDSSRFRKKAGDAKFRVYHSFVSVLMSLVAESGRSRAGIDGVGNAVTDRSPDSV